MTERERFEAWAKPKHPRWRFDKSRSDDGYMYQSAATAWKAWCAALSAPPGWIPVSERMPESGAVVLACYTNRAGKLRRIRAMWLAAKSSECNSDSDIGVYDEATDTIYDPEGWYEKVDNWDDYTAVVVNEGEITHWMQLPAAPSAKEPTP